MKQANETETCADFFHFFFRIGALKAGDNRFEIPGVGRISKVGIINILQDNHWQMPPRLEEDAHHAIFLLCVRSDDVKAFPDVVL